jgi:hypothetical protein
MKRLQKHVFTVLPAPYQIGEIVLYIPASDYGGKVVIGLRKLYTKTKVGAGLVMYDVY